jgi:O-antigen biosynthesis protein
MFLPSISIFTPTNNTKFLLELYRSIQFQNYEEWVVYPNGNVTVADIPEEILNDSRTVIVESEDPPSSNIGAVKGIACSACRCQILCEVDQDDILVPGIFQKIKEAFIDPEVVFAYSDCAQFNDDAQRSPRFFGSANAENNYDDMYGWEYYDLVHDGYLYKPAKCPEPTPDHVSIIHYAPDHIRAFRKTAYDLVGGYDPSLSVLDDADLMARLYTAGKFKHIQECGYLYRVHGDNSWLLRNEAIQEGMLEMQKRYLHPLVEHWGVANGYTMINLGGRFNNPNNYLSVDLHSADINCDLNEEHWPFEDSSVAVVRCFDILEHLKNPINTMKEIYRILMPGGYLLSMTPSTDGRGAWMDPTHVSGFNQNSFWYYTKQTSAQYIDTPVRFKEIIVETVFPNEWALLNDISYVRADLISLKENFRPHGYIEI